MSAVIFSMQAIWQVSEQASRIQKMQESLYLALSHYQKPKPPLTTTESTADSRESLLATDLVTASFEGCIFSHMCYLMGNSKELRSITY
jgi:hypothetical protein